MQLHKNTALNRIAKKLANPLSRIVCSKHMVTPSRMADAYLNFLLGKGSGTGWDIHHEIIAAASHITSAKPLVFDIGANIGTWSSQLLAEIPGANIYMFEPSPTCRAELHARFPDNTKLFPYAIGEQNGLAHLHFSSTTDGSASLHKRNDSCFAELNYTTVEVEVRTIDSIIQMDQVEFVDYIKLDIEGHELFALKGATQSLTEKRIGALSFEFGTGNINSRTYFKDFWEFLTSFNFRILRITPGNKIIPISDYYEDLEYFRGVSNYLAVHKQN